MRIVCTDYAYNLSMQDHTELQALMHACVPHCSSQLPGSTLDHHFCDCHVTCPFYFPFAPSQHAAVMMTMSGNGPPVAVAATGEAAVVVSQTAAA